MIELILVHMIDGREVQINPAEIVRMRTGRDEDDPKRQFPADVNCVIAFTDGKFLSVSETCSQVRELIEGESK